jgi:hypothetical protein
MIYPNSNWWVGVIEDRKDPEKMGRCKVRIFGYHPPDKGTLSTDDLPWAMLMTPATSASISGVGTSPVGILEGSWVVGFFMDGSDGQQPIIVGTVPGKPEEEDNKNKAGSENSSKGSSGTSGSAGGRSPTTAGGSDQSGLLQPSRTLTNDRNEPVYDGQGNPILLTKDDYYSDPTDITNRRAVNSTLPPLGVEDVTSVLDTLQSNRTADGIGKFNLTVDNLEKMGLIKKPLSSNNRDDIVNNPANWTNIYGVNSLNTFLANQRLQDELTSKLVEKTYDELVSTNRIDPRSSTKAQAAGLIVAAIRTGISSLSQLDRKDRNGIPASDYYRMGASRFGDTDIPAVSRASAGINRTGNFGGSPTNPSNNPAGQLNDMNAVNTEGFKDPNKVYPTKEYTEKKLPDTNKLAAEDKTSNVLIYKEENRIKDIQIAFTEDKWNEPVSPYSAKYPYNQVVATEAGHVIEFDNTPGRERIHLWHKANTYIEVDVNGTSVRKVVGDNYEVIEKNEYIYVKGAQKTTVEGVQRVLVKDSMYVQVMGDINIAGQSDIKINGAKTVNLTGTDEVKIQSSGPVNMYSDATVTVQGGPMIHLNPGRVNNQFFKPPKLEPKENEPDPLEAPTSTEEDFENETGEEGSDEVRQQRIAQGKIQDRALVEKDSDSSPGVNNASKEVSVDRSEFTKNSVLPDTLRLSKHFTLGALSSRAPASPTELKDQRGLTKSEIAGNLKSLAVNVLDPIKDKFPDMTVTSGFRSSSSTSDHDIGAAADIQFETKSPAEYFEAAKWIKDNVPHKQLLLEYQDKPDGRRIAWVHVAYKEGAPKSKLDIGTMYNHDVYRRGSLVKLQ